MSLLSRLCTVTPDMYRVGVSKVSPYDPTFSDIPGVPQMSQLRMLIHLSSAQMPRTPCLVYLYPRFYRSKHSAELWEAAFSSPLLWAPQWGYPWLPSTSSSSSRSTCTSYWRACGRESRTEPPSPCSATYEDFSSNGTSGPCGGRSSYCRAEPVVFWPGEAHRRGSLWCPSGSEEPRLK